MLTKQQLNIFSAFMQNLFQDLTFKQIKKMSRQKSNNILQIALGEFKKQKIVTVKKTGDVTTYALNLDNNLTLAYLNLANEQKLKQKKLPHKILRVIQQNVIKQTEFFTLLIFGSHAKNKATEKSDLDIAIIIDSEQLKTKITPALETIKRRELIKIDYHIFTNTEFTEMLKTEYENVGKQIYKTALVHYGFINYLHLINPKLLRFAHQ